MFFKEVEDFKKYIPVTHNFVFEEMEIYLRNVQSKVLKEYLGKTFLDQLQTIFNDADSADDVADPYKELIEHLRMCTAHLAISSWLPFGQVHISQLGISINSTQDMKTAFQWQIKDIEEYCNENGYQALEDALEYLEENISNADFAAYKSSNQYKENNYLFVPSAIEFCKHASSFQKSHVNFFKLRSMIRQVEDFDIRGTIMPGLFDDLKTKLQSGDPLGTLSKKIVDLIKPALVNLTIYKGITNLSINIDSKGIMYFDNTGNTQTQETKTIAPDSTLGRFSKSAEKVGKAYLQQLREYLEANKDNYPLFKNDARYKAPADKININDGSNPFFSAI